MARTLPVHPVLRHPHTGRPLQAVGVLASGRVIWPVLGGDPTDPLTRINELVALGWQTLTGEQLTELRGLLDAERQAIAGNDQVDAGHIRQVADLASQMREESDRRDQAAAAVDDDRTRLEAAFAQPAAGGDGAAAGGDGAPGGDGGQAAGTPAGDGGAAAGDPATAGQAAGDGAGQQVQAVSAARPAPLSAVVQTANQHRESEAGQQGGTVVATLTAAAGPATGRALQELSDDEVSQNLAEGFDQVFRDIRTMRAAPGAPSRIPVLASRWDTGGDRVAGNDADRNRRLMDERLAALTASGGICRPVGVDYNVPTWSNVEEPFKASLPSIGAERGGLQYGLPVPYDATVYEPGVGIWSEPNDRNPGGSNTGPLSNPTGTGPATKPCIEIDCSNFAETDVEAITECAIASNFRALFSPENMNVLLTYLQQAFVSVAERERLKQARAACTHNSSAQVLGASRDIFDFCDKIRAYYRSRYRLSDNVPLRMTTIAYVREVIRIDLRKGAFPYEAGPGAPAMSLDVEDAIIDSLFARKNIVPVWVLDDDTGDQIFAKAAAGAALPGNPVAFPSFPAGTASNSVRVRAMFYPEGTFQLLDGGMLNLGVVRDSVLNAANKFQIFSEIFEAVAFRGFEATDWKIDLVADGSTAGTATPTAAI